MKVIWRLSPWFLPALCVIGGLLTKSPAISQEIIPAENGTNTQINRNGNQINIEGGTQSQDGTNLFHDLEKFGVGAGETVIFNSAPEIFNILTRITIF
jgi:large exoprotein involved in heme utilization and adhesion